jgi:FSR family fosmidomycin resistance protein-like MFS transporter
MGALAAGLVLPAWQTRVPHAGRRSAQEEGWSGFLTGLGGAWKALRSGIVLRWLVLLELSDLMLDILFGFIALYFVDVVGVPIGQAAVAVVLWTLSGLLGDLLVIPLLEQMPGLLYLRASAAVAAALFPLFLLVGPVPLKLALLILLGLVKAGWYSVLKARLYAAMPGKGGAAMAVSNVAGLAGSLIPLALGAAAEAVGLRSAMWLLLAAPIGLLIGLPRTRQRRRGRRRASATPASRRPGAPTSRGRASSGGQERSRRRTGAGKKRRGALSHGGAAEYIS